MNCVSFLVNYGVNLWAKDIDQHTATELAAMNDRHAILRFLDDQVAKEERANPKKVKSLKEKVRHTDSTRLATVISWIIDAIQNENIGRMMFSSNPFELSQV